MSVKEKLVKEIARLNHSLNFELKLQEQAKSKYIWYDDSVIRLLRGRIEELENELKTMQ